MFTVEIQFYNRNSNLRRLRKYNVPSILCRTRWKNPTVPLYQLNLVNSKSSGLEVLFRIISNSNYRKVRTNTKISFFIKQKFWVRKRNVSKKIFSIKHKFWVCKRNVSLRFILSNISFGCLKETSQRDFFYQT